MTRQWPPVRGVCEDPDARMPRLAMRGRASYECLHSTVTHRQRVLARCSVSASALQ